MTPTLPLPSAPTPTDSGEPANDAPMNFVVCFDSPKCIPYGRDFDLTYFSNRRFAELFASMRTFRGEAAKVWPA